MRVQAMLSAVVLVQVLSACGGDGDSHHAVQVQSVVKGEKKLSELSADERLTLCRDIYAADSTSEASSVHSVCGIQAEGANDCQKTYDSCTAHPPKGIGQKYTNKDAEIIAQTSPADCDEMLPKTCTATVDEAIRCANYEIREFSDYYESFTCDGDEPDDETVPAACKALVDKCPELFNDGDGEDDSSSASVPAE